MKEYKVRKHNLKKIFSVTYQDKFNGEIIIDKISGEELYFVANNPDLMMINIKKN